MTQKRIKLASSVWIPPLGYLLGEQDTVYPLFLWNPNQLSPLSTAHLGLQQSTLLTTTKQGGKSLI